MRKTLFFSFVLLLLAHFNANAQTDLDPLTAGFDKTKPVQLVAYLPISQTGDNQGKRYLRKNSDFSDDQVDTIFKRIVAWTGKPKSINNYEGKGKEALPYYKAYNLSDFSVLKYSFLLVWIPYEENQHMPEEFRPTSKEGFLFYTTKTNVSTTGKGLAGKTLPKAGSEYKKAASNSSISVSSADMSSQVVNGKSGVMIIYYGNKSTEIAKSASAYTLYGNKQGYTGGLKNEKAIAEEIAKRGAYSEYIGYYFIKGGDCPDAERYLKGKFNISAKDMRFFFYCTPELYVNN